jgi:hypothetical protein
MSFVKHLEYRAGNPTDRGNAARRPKPFPPLLRFGWGQFPRFHLCVDYVWSAYGNHGEANPTYAGRESCESIKFHELLSRPQ